MDHKQKTTCVCLATFLGSLAWVCQAALAQPDQGEELFRRACPHLEAVMGFHYDQPPVIRRAAATALRSDPDKTLEAHLRWQFPDLRGEALARTVTLTQAVLRQATVAWYQENTKTIWYCPENQARIARWDDSLARVDSPAFLQLALVLEAARAELDRRYHVSQQVGECHSAEDSQALEAIFEGRAMAITRHVARRLGTEAYFPLLSHIYLRVPDIDPDPALRSASQEYLRLRHRLGNQGLEIYDYLNTNSVVYQEAELFANPPHSINWLERPDLFAPPNEFKMPILAKALAPVTKELPASDWEGKLRGWSTENVLLVADLVHERTRAEKVLTSGQSDGEMVVWAPKSNPTSQVALSVVRFKTASAARAYHAFAMELQRKLDEAKTPALPQVLDSHSQAITLPAAEEAILTTKRLQLPAGDDSMTSSTFLIRADSLVLEITWFGVPADTAWAQRLVTLVLKQAAAHP
jgi:hypothetical protein